MPKESRNFTLQEAKKALPQVKQITEKYAVEVEKLQKARATAESPEEDSRLAQSIDRALATWMEKIMVMGGVPKGLWLVDFDSGNGYFCWLRGENDIVFFHGYEEGFAGRVPLQ